MNNLEYAAIFHATLDKQVVQQAITGWMEPNADMVQYNGGREVKIAKIAMDGLADYDRKKGYAPGAVTLEWETRTLTMDRGRQFLVDAMDVDETKYQASIANVAGEFQRTKVIPEIDAYRICKIARIAGVSRTRAYTPAANTVFGALLDDLNTVYDKVGFGTPLVIQISIPVLGMLGKSTEFQRALDPVSFERGELKTQVKGIDGAPLLPCTSGLMKTAFEFASGREEGDQGGYKVATDAVDINWQIIAKRAPIAISKTNPARFYSPEQNQDADAWKYNYRKYHDLWVLDNQLGGLFVNAKTMPTYE